jgi:hypothetical protein
MTPFARLCPGNSPSETFAGGALPSVLRVGLASGLEELIHGHADILTDLTEKNR